MNSDFEGFCDDGFGCIMLAVGVGAVAVAGLGVYGLRKAGVTGKQAWLGVLAAPVVWYGWKAAATSGRREMLAPTSTTPTAQPPQPVALKDFQLMDILGRGIV